MKLSTTSIAQLNTIINVCSLVNIDMLSIDATDTPSKLSGINDDRTCVIITDTNVPELEVGSKMGIKKLKILKQRLDLFKLDPSLSITVNKKPNGEVSELAIKGSKASSSYRTANLISVKCPSAIDDTPVKRISLTQEEVQFILNAERAMGSKKITINVKSDNSVVLELTDSNNDLTSVEITSIAEDIGTNSGSFVSYYFTEIFSPLIKAAMAENEIVAIDLYEASAKISVSGYTLIMIAPMDND